MGRTVVADDATISTQFDELVQNASGPCTGLLIGMNSAQRTLVTSVILTPAEGDDPVESLADISVSWVEEHARQVACMLSGGVQVVGLFVFASSAEMSKSLRLLRAVLKGCCDEKAEALVVQKCSDSSRLICKTHKCDASGQVQDGKPATFKFQKLGGKLHVFNASVRVHVELPVGSDRQMTAARLSHLENSLSRVVGGRAIVRIDGKMYSKGSNACVQDLDGMEHDVTLFFGCSDDALSLRYGGETESLLTLTGLVHSRTYAFFKDPISTVVETLQADVCASIRHRLTILQEEDALDQHGQTYELPRRVFFPTASAAQFCDYLVPEDTAEECAERCSELLSVKVSANSLDYAEKAAKLPVPVQSVEKSPQANTAVPGEKGKAAKAESIPQHGNTRLTVPAGVAAVAVLVAWFLLS